MLPLTTKSTQLPGSPADVLRYPIPAAAPEIPGIPRPYLVSEPGRGLQQLHTQRRAHPLPVVARQHKQPLHLAHLLQRQARHLR